MLEEKVVETKVDVSCHAINETKQVEPEKIQFQTTGKNIACTACSCEKKNVEQVAEVEHSKECQSKICRPAQKVSSTVETEGAQLNRSLVCTYIVCEIGCF